MEHGRLTGWEVMETDDGNILQSGLRTRAHVHHQDVENAAGWVTRAVVLQTYYADEDNRNGWVKEQRCVTCDVRTYGRFQRFLARVPVLQRTHGLWDEDIYIPRKARQNIEGGDLVAQPSKAIKPTSAEKTDGDHVLIGFLDNDPNQPVILPFVMPHPKSNYAPKAADGHVRRIRHNGVSITWDSSGNLMIDATGAAKEVLAASGQEDSSSGTGGQITIQTKDGANAVSQIKLDNSGGVLLEAGEGSVKLELTKNATALLKAKTVATVSAGTKDILDAPLVELSTAPLEPIIKGATYNSQEAIRIGLLTAHITAVAAGFAALAAFPVLLPIAPVLGAVAAPASAAIAGNAAFLAASSAWTSTKVTTG